MIVYKITNKQNGNFYIGKTTKTISSRWSQHKHCAFKKIPKTKFHKAINKYGAEAWNLEILETAPNLESLNKAELFFIEKERPYYNLTSKGSATGRKWTEEEKKTRKKPCKPEPIICLTTGEEFDSINVAAKHFGCSASGISNVANGRKKTINGNCFVFKNEEKRLKADKLRQTKEKNIKKFKTNGIKVFCKNTGQEFNSIKEAARFLNVAEISMRKHLQKIRPTIRGLIFNYKEQIT